MTCMCWTARLLKLDQTLFERHTVRICPAQAMSKESLDEGLKLLWMNASASCEPMDALIQVPG